MEAIKKPQFQVLYNSKDISKDISKSLISVTYSDAEEGETDEVQIELEDTDGLWRDSWYPQKKDSIELSIGYDGVLMYCGKFVIDEVALRGAPDTVTLRGLAAAISSPLRSKNSTAHESQTLKQIAEKIATKNGLTVSGEIGNIAIARVTQNRETDLAFLARVAKEYGYLFSIRDKNLIFTSIYNIEKGQPVLDIDRTDLISYSVTDKSVKTFKAATVKYREPKTNKVVSATVKAGDPLEGGDGVVGGATSTTADDEMLITAKAENEQQARLKAQAALHRANTTGQDGNFTLYGEPLFVAGNNFLLTGMGALSGRWHISKSTHTISRSGGYVTSMDAKRLKDVEKPEQKKTPTKKKPKARYKVKSGGGGGGVRSLYSGTA